MLNSHFFKSVALRLQRAKHFIPRLAARRRFRREAMALPRALPVLSYGGAIPRDRDAIVQGGRVKLLHLNEEFPEASTNYNVLYLVSSAIPPDAAELVRWAKESGVKFVWNQNGVAYRAWAGPWYYLQNQSMAELLHAADFVFYQSQFCQRSADRFLRPTSAPQAIAYNCVDTERFCPRPPHAEPVAPGPVRLLVVGTHQQFHRVTLAIETLARLQQRGLAASLTIAGPLTWRTARRDLAQLLTAELRPHITVLPAFSQAEAIALYQAHDILLHLKYNDPCPTVVLEAMACGLPVVGSGSGGMPELVAADCGELLPVDDGWERDEWPSPTAVAEAVGRVAAQRERYGRQARLHVERHFDKRPWVEQHRQVFQELLE